MYTSDNFDFTEEDTALDGAVRIDATIRDPPSLFATIARNLQFPDYFGENWNALIDCLSDLSWLGDREAILEHPELPALTEEDLRLYLESLSAVAARIRGRADAMPHLRLIFRQRDRSAIDRTLRGVPNDKNGVGNVKE